MRSVNQRVVKEIRTSYLFRGMVIDYSVRDDTSMVQVTVMVVLELEVAIEKIVIAQEIAPRGI